MIHPFAEHIGLVVESQEDGQSRCSITVCETHLNPHGVVHGAVICALADNGMGAALYPSLQPGQLCATIEIKINYYRPVKSGLLRCDTVVVNRGKRIANLEASIFRDAVLVAKANGNYSIFTPSGDRT